MLPGRPHSLRLLVEKTYADHGIPVNLPQHVYDALSGGTLHNYWANQLDNREAYYYRRVYLGCLRSNDLLTSRDNWNGKDLLVMGASQGGETDPIELWGRRIGRGLSLVGVVVLGLWLLVQLGIL